MCLDEVAWELEPLKEVAFKQHQPREPVAVSIPERTETLFGSNRVHFVIDVNNVFLLFGGYRIWKHD